MDVELYHKHNALHRRDAFNILQEYQEKIKWKPNDCRVMDVGCGDGGVTVEVIKEFLPKNYLQLYGSDVNENMIDFANKHWSDDRSKFFMFNLEGEMDNQFKSSFDHVLSFYALNWVLNQKQAFSNIYDMLVLGGNCILVFLGYSATYDAYRSLSHGDKWSLWVRDAEKFISPFHDSKFPQDEVEALMRKLGFKDIEVSYRPMAFSHYSYEFFKNLVKSLSAFNIPKEYMDEYAVDILEKMVSKVNDETGNATYVFKYKVIVAFGSK